MRSMAARALAVAAVAVALCGAVAEPGDAEEASSVDFETGRIGEMKVNLNFASLDVVGDMRGFQKLDGVAKEADKITKRDQEYVPETSTGPGQCFHGTRRQLLARSACQTCSIMVSHMYMALFEHMFAHAGTIAHPRLAHRRKWEVSFNPGDYELNEELFEETVLPDGKKAIVETKKLQNLRKEFVLGTMLAEVKQQLCGGEGDPDPYSGTSVWGRRFWEGRGDACPDSKGCFMNHKYCTQAVQGMMERFVDRRLHLFVERSCHYQQDGEFKRSLPMQCRVRTVCSCLQRCPEGGTTSDQGCEDGCKCKATSSQGLTKADINMYKELQWVIDMSRNIGLRHLPHGDEWTNEIAMRKEQYGNLVEQLNAVKSQYDEIKKAMPASGTEEKIISRSATVKAGTPAIKKTDGKIYSCSLVGDGSAAFPGKADGDVSLGGTLTSTLAADAVYPEDAAQESCLKSKTCPELDATVGLSYSLSCTYTVESTLDLGATVSEVTVGPGKLPPLNTALPSWTEPPTVPKIDPPKATVLSIDATPKCIKGNDTPNRMVYKEDLEAGKLEEEGKDPVKFLSAFVVATRERIKDFVENSEAWRKEVEALLANLSKILVSNRKVVAQARQVLDKAKKDSDAAKGSQSDSAEEAAAAALKEEFDEALEDAQDSLTTFAQSVLATAETKIAPNAIAA